MHSIKNIVRSLLLLFIIACASDRAVSPPEADAGSLRAPKPQFVAPLSIKDPEQGLKTAIDGYRAGNYEASLLILHRIAGQHPGSPWHKRSLFVSEQIFLQTDRPSEAEAMMLRIKSEYPRMADYAVSILADYHYSKGNFTRAAALYQDLMERYPESSLGPRAFFRRGRALLDASAWSPAAEALGAFLEEHQNSEFAPDAGAALGLALTREGRSEEAVQAYRRVWAAYPGTAAEAAAVKALAELRSMGVTVAPWTADELFERGRNFFRALQYEKAVDAFDAALEKEPGYPRRSEALYRTGISQYNLGKRGDAIATLEKLVREFPRDHRVPEALFWTGRSYNKLGDSEKGIRILRKVYEAYPGNEWADDALFLIGNIYRESDDMSKALPFYRKLVADYRDSRFSDSALWWNAWSSYRRADLPKADRELQDLVERYPRSFLVYQALYWRGRIAEKNGAADKAAAYYRKLLNRGPYTYYGHRAAERLAALDVPAMAPGQDPVVELTAGCADEPCFDEAPAPDENDAGPPVWTEETRKLLAAEPSFGKSLELMHLDMKKEAAAELWYLQGRLPRKKGALIGLSKAFFELGDYYRSLILVLRNYEHYLDGRTRSTPEDLWVLAYPRGYWDTILAYSRKYGQDPYLIAAIIRQESQFHTEALSPAGARGVMQVMPATGEWIARTIRMPGFERARLFDQETAINLGTWYVGHLMKRFKGDPLFVAAAYNAGPEAVSNWLGRNGTGTIERDEFIEAIPYAETRGYVKKVLRNYAEYKRIYAKTIPPFPRFFENSDAAGAQVSENKVRE